MMSELGLIERSTAEELATQARRLSGTTEALTPQEALALLQNVKAATDTYILVDEDGQEYAAVLVSEETVFTATANDIRKGTVAATASGVTEGTKVIPSYHTSEGYRGIKSGKEFTIPLVASDGYDFTKLQIIICPYSGSIDGSVAAEMVVINEGVYLVNSTTEIATVTKNSETKSISLGLTNETENLYLLRYITYREVI